VTNREPGIKQCSTAYYEKPVSPSGSPLTAAPAFADGPSADFKLNREARVFISRDKTVQLEQYAKKQEEGLSSTNSGPSTENIGILSSLIPAKFPEPK
jgi:hypothetical protein